MVSLGVGERQSLRTGRDAAWQAGSASCAEASIGPENRHGTATIGREVRSDAESGRILDRLIGAALLVTIVALIIGLLVAPRSAQAAQLHPDRSCRSSSLTASKAIDCIWPERSRAAAHRVAECESTASASPRVARRRGLGRWARNGQYAGIFQMGVRERAAHGWYRVGSPARVQVRAALSLYRSRGWQPWSCA